MNVGEIKIDQPVKIQLKRQKLNELGIGAKIKDRQTETEYSMNHGTSELGYSVLQSNMWIPRATKGLFTMA